MKIRHIVSATAGLAALVSASAVYAQDSYISVSSGTAMLSKSENKGEFTSDFTTGAGTTIPSGTPLPAGTSLGWETKFDHGMPLSVAYGRQYMPNMRAEIELSYQANDVSRHSNVMAAGIDLDGEDAGVLISGSPNLGVSVGDLVSDGRGYVRSTYLMANAYYDFGTGPWRPFIGAGLGVASADVKYAPSGVGIVDDQVTTFAYQLIGGASYDISDSMSLYGQYRYRATPRLETEVNLFDAELDVENASSNVEIGLRFKF